MSSDSEAGELRRGEADVVDDYVVACAEGAEDAVCAEVDGTVIVETEVVEDGLLHCQSVRIVVVSVAD